MDQSAIGSKLTPFTYSEARDLIQICRNGDLESIRSEKIIFPTLTARTLEIAGMPQSYKSTLILYNVVHFRKNGLKTDYIRERLSPINKRLYPAHYSVSLANKTIEELLTMNKEQVYLLDRGTYDQLAFLHTYLKFGFIDKQTFETASDYLISFSTNKIAGVIICQSNPQDSLQREGERNTVGFVMNFQFLKQLEDSYKFLPKLISETRARCGLGNEAFPVISLGSSTSWSEYSSLFLKSTTTLLQLNMYGV